MRDFGPFQKIARAIAFGRRVPLSKIARRIELDLKRRVKQRGAKPAPAAAPSLSARLPAPLFKPRLGKLDFRDGRPRLTFVGRACEMKEPLDWRAGGDGPANQLWRMNLHYMEYLEEADDSLFADLVRQWIDANPPYARGYWKDSWNSYTVSLRTVVWMQQLALRGARLDAATREAAVASLAQQIRFLEVNLETDIGGNHLIKNIKALLLASAFFAGSEAERWRALGLRLLTEELHGQVLADGTHYERSPSYHCQVFADLLECRQALGDDPLNGALDDALARMARAAVDLSHPDGHVALFNDAGLSMAYSPGNASTPMRAFTDKGPLHGRYSLSRTPAISGCGAARPISSSIADASLPTNFRRMVMATWRASNYRSPDNASSSIKAFTNTSLASDANARVPPRTTTRSVSTTPIRRTSLAPFDADAGRTSRFWSTKPETKASRSRRPTTAFAIFPARPATSGASRSRPTASK